MLLSRFSKHDNCSQTQIAKRQLTSMLPSLPPGEYNRLARARNTNSTLYTAGIPSAAELWVSILHSSFDGFSTTTLSAGGK